MTEIEQVFISHATADAQFAHRLADDLRRLGVRVWIAPESIHPGESWVSAIERGLGESSHAVVVLTPAALESEWVKKETDVTIAQERKGRIQVIPLDVKPCAVPLFLSSYQMVPFRRCGYDAGLSQLADILGVRIPPEPKVPVPPPVVKKPVEKKVAPPLVEPVAVAKKEPEPPTAPPASEAVPKKALRVGALVAGGLVLLCIVGIIISAIYRWALPTPTEAPLGMVYVPAGEFIMGSDEGDSDEQPVHTLYLDAFYIDKYEVTNTQYWECVQAGACDAPLKTTYYDNADYAQHPVVYVSWADADTYCRWVDKRLPTETEWEKACRGTTGWTYPWSEGIDCDHAQYSECGGRTVPVGSKPKGASQYGAWDMAGNVWEWVADWYDSDYYSQSPARNPPGPDSDKGRVLRGGSWYYRQKDARCSSRDWVNPWYRGGIVGFRCARGSQ